MTKPLASLSLDLDNKWSYLKTHGDRGWEQLPSYLGTVVPMFLDMVERLGLRITVFVVGQDAARAENHRPLKAIASAGHEIGNHSFHHEPWLHLYSAAQIEREIATAEEAIAEATAAQPVGFRGPGYSASPALFACLARRGYRYDASSLPAVIGPLARAYYFMTARLSADERQQRRQLFGGIREGWKPLAPYWWHLQGSEFSGGEDRLLEIPVTTLPLARVPIHFSYLLFIAQHSPRLASAYWWMALALCRWRGIEPSLLLHPLDFLGGDEEPDLGFFPAMKMCGTVKRALVERWLGDLSSQFTVVTLREHAETIAARSGIPVRAAIVAAEKCGLHQQSAQAEPALTMEVRS